MEWKPRSLIYPDDRPHLAPTHGPNGSSCGPGGPIHCGAVRGLLIVNPQAGDERPTVEELRAEAEKRSVDVRLLERDDDPAAVARESEAEAVGVAGGDGSLGPVAAVAIERGLAFVCIPFGTRNHFARDVGLDRDDPIGALDAFVDGREQRIDVGSADDRVFLNNVSLGVYARLVHRRERHRRRREALARLRALARLLHAREPLAITVDGEALEARVVVVANNDYLLEPWSLGARERLDEGELHLYAASGLLRSTWEKRSGTRFVIDAAGRRIAAAVDGEPVELEMPIEFEIRPRALRLLLPG
jgi:diacylglycerol kinase family enzyme